jgi:hypothetical protein
MTPYETMYGPQPPTITSYLLDTQKVQAIDKLLQGREITLAALKENLHLAQNHLEQQVDQKRSKRVFQEGSGVSLNPTLQANIAPRSSHHKLAPKFYGPYQILKGIGPISYKLALLAASKIHPVFPVSYLKKVVGHNCWIQTILPKLDEEGSIGLQPKYDLNMRERHLWGRTIK